MPRLQRPDASLAYETHGDGSPVLLLHGFTQRGESWDPVIQHVRAPHRWIVPDVRGHGRTSTMAGAAHDLDACTLDTTALLDELGVARAHLAGYSMGGRLALHVAVAHPERVRSLCLVSAHAGLVEGERSSRRAHDDALASQIESEGVQWFAAHWSALPMFDSLRRRRPLVAASLLQTREQGDAHGLAESLREMGAGAMHPLWDALPHVTAPVLVIAGEEDERFVAFGRRLQASLPHARLQLIASAGHAAHLEQPHAVAAVMERFLAEVESEARS